MTLVEMVKAQTAAPDDVRALPALRSRGFSPADVIAVIARSEGEWLRQRLQPDPHGSGLGRRDPRRRDRDPGHELALVDQPAWRPAIVGEWSADRVVIFTRYSA
jgi:hypothetical protein